MKHVTISAERAIAAPASTVWEAVADLPAYAQPAAALVLRNLDRGTHRGRQPGNACLRGGASLPPAGRTLLGLMGRRARGELEDIVAAYEHTATYGAYLRAA